MNTKELSQILRQSLLSHTILKIEIGELVTAIGDSLEELNKDLERKDTLLHKAGVYLLGDGIDVLYIGQGGPNQKGDGGTMGHRVYQHISKKEWRNEIRRVVFVPVIPREFSRLAEQEALAIYFQKKGTLPKYQQIWG